MADNQDDIYKYQPLWENWYIDMPIGKGSFGSVYKISREDMGHKYTSAVKIISIPSDEQYKEAEASFGGDEASLSGYFESIVHNLVNEINMLYSLKGNSNIVDYEDHRVVKKEDSVGWDILIRMEYVTSLKKYIAGHQMSKREIIKLGIDICSALELCSNRGIIHRDIKDDNIFVNQDGVFKLGDFGISKELSKSGRAASMRGTPLYMAPEVYRGDKYDAVVDIYSLGIVMYKLLNHGRMPFMPPYPETILFKDSEAALEKRMSGQKLSLPDQAGKALGDVIVKACAYKAEDRYATAIEMKRDLEKVLNSLPDAAKDELVTMINIKSLELTQASQSAITSQPEQKEKTVSIFGASAGPNQAKESEQASTELPQRDLNKTESIFASRPEMATTVAETASDDQETEVTTGSKKTYKPSKAVIAAIAATILIVLIFAVTMNRADKSNQTSSQSDTKSANVASTSSSTEPSQTSTNAATTLPSSQTFVTDKSFQNIKDKGYFTLGLDDSFTPMGFHDANTNEIIGFDIDLAKEAAKRMGVKVKFQPIRWDEIVEEINNGDVDVIWSGLVITSKYEKQFAFTKPYMADRQIIVVKKGSTITDKKGLVGQKVGIQAGSVANQVLDEDTVTEKELVKFDTISDALLDLKSGRIDAVVVDEVMGRYYLAKQAEDYAVLDDNFGSEDFGVGLRKNDKAFLFELQKALDAMKADGTTAKISVKWFGADIMK